jgi:hypothetical protein
VLPVGARMPGGMRPQVPVAGIASWFWELRWKAVRLPVLRGIMCWRWCAFHHKGRGMKNDEDTEKQATWFTSLVYCNTANKTKHLIITTDAHEAKWGGAMAHHVRRIYAVGCVRIISTLHIQKQKKKLRHTFSIKKTILFFDVYCLIKAFFIISFSLCLFLLKRRTLNFSEVICCEVSLLTNGLWVPCQLGFQKENKNCCYHLLWNVSSSSPLQLVRVPRISSIYKHKTWPNRHH